MRVMRLPAVRSAGMPFMTALAVLATAALVLGIVRVARRDVPAPGATPGDPVLVGLVPGESVPAYLGASDRDLRALTDPSAPAAGETWALVSLDHYETPAHVAALLEGSVAAQVYTRVPLAGVSTAVSRVPVLGLPGDALSGMAAQAVLLDRDQERYLQLARRVRGDGDDAQRAREAYGQEAATAQAEANAYRQGCACLFAAVIRAEPGALQAIANRSGVRVVDPAPEVRSLDETEFSPLRPEQTGIAPRTATPLVSSSGAGVTSTSSAGSASGETAPS